MHVSRHAECARDNLPIVADGLEARHRLCRATSVGQAVASQDAHQARRRASASSGPSGPSSIRASRRKR
jgi:hypothetical protein